MQIVALSCENEIDPNCLIVHVAKGGEGQLITVPLRSWNLRANVLHHTVRSCHRLVCIVVGSAIEVSCKNNSRCFTLGRSSLDFLQSELRAFSSSLGPNVIEVSASNHDLLAGFYVSETADGDKADVRSVPAVARLVGGCT